MVDALLGVGSITAVLFSAFAVYYLARRDTRHEEVVDAIRDNAAIIDYIQGWLAGRFTTYIRR